MKYVQPLPDKPGFLLPITGMTFFWGSVCASTWVDLPSTRAKSHSINLFVADVAGKTGNM